LPLMIHAPLGYDTPRGFLFPTSNNVFVVSIDKNKIMGRIYFEGAFDHFDKAYGQECVDRLKADKTFPLVVTPKQAVIILEPSDAPENFYCDGEVTHEEAVADFKEKLKLVGFNPMYVKVIVDYLQL